MSAAVNTPCSLAPPLRTAMPVLSLRRVTDAPGTADPDASFTVTVTVPVSSCASAGEINRTARQTNPQGLPMLRNIFPPEGILECDCTSNDCAHGDTMAS